MTNELQVAAKMGTLSNGAQRNHGLVLHLVPGSVQHYGRGAALCGTKPGRRSIGWATDYEGQAPTCKRCIAKAEAQHDE